jgi:ParB-like chromosome segregation protein Spo0J
MAVLMTPDADFRMAEESTAVISGNAIPDPMSLIDQLPEVSVPVSSLVPGFHLRQDGTDAAHVRLLADAAGSARLPSILVQRCGTRIIDGMHRVEVAKLRGEWNIRARIVDCTDEEALVLAVKSNTLHGLPLTRADRISSAKRILADHADWSDRSVAVITGLSAKAIASLRNSSTGEIPFYGKRLGRDGKRRPIVPSEGRRRAAEYISAHPDASLREVARETDVSLGTVHDVRERMRRGEEQHGHVPARPAQQAAAAQTELAPADGPGPVTAEPASTGPTSTGPAIMRPAPAGPAPEGPSVTSPPIRALHAAVAARGAPRVAWSTVATKLAGDPTIRYTEGGRAFLRWMSGHSMQSDEWREFVDAIPQHWLDEVSRIAVSMSEEWRQFADRLGNKMEAAS